MNNLAKAEEFYIQALNFVSEYKVNSANYKNTPAFDYLGKHLAYEKRQKIEILKMLKDFYEITGNEQKEVFYRKKYDDLRKQEKTMEDYRDKDIVYFY